MEKRLELIKKSVMIHNDEGKILVLKAINHSKLYIPSISIFNTSKNCEQNHRYKKWIDLLLPLEDLEFLSRTTKEVYQTENQANLKKLLYLKEQILYYSYYHILEKEEIEQIIKLGIQHDFEPYMLTPYEIIHSNCSVEKGCKPALKVLQDKLKYKIY